MEGERERGRVIGREGGIAGQRRWREWREGEIRT